MLALCIFICVNLYIINLTSDQIHIIDKKIIQFACVTKNCNVNLNRKKKSATKADKKITVINSLPLSYFIPYKLHQTVIKRKICLVFFFF